MTRLGWALAATALCAACRGTPAYRPNARKAPAELAVAPAANARLLPPGGAAAVPATPLAPTGEGHGLAPGVMGRPADTGFDSVGTIATVVTAVVLLPLTFSDDLDTREATGDVLQILLPAAAFGGTVLEGDREGAGMFARSFFTSWATTYVLKYSVDKWRPSGSNPESFPSGHTMGAFAGASFIQQRYGSRFGIPAYLGAVFTGISRVDSENHFMDDVVAGASISMLSTWYWVSPISGTTSIEPVVDGSGGVGIGLRVGNETQHTVRDRHHQPEDDFEKRFRFEWAFGAAHQDTNTVQSPPGTGDVIHLEDFRDVADTTTTSQATFEYFPVERHEFAVRYSPFEVRDSGTLDAPASFNGVTLNAGAVSSAYRNYDARGWYRYVIPTPGRWTAKVGLALAVMDLGIQISDGVNTASLDDTVLVPAAHVHVGYWFTPRLWVFAESDIGSFQGDDLVDGNVMARYALSRQWDVGLGYRFVHRRIDDEELVHQLDQNRLLLAVGHSF